MSRVACETLVTTGVAFVAGEFTTKANVNISDIVRNTIKEMAILMPQWDSIIIHAPLLQALENNPQISLRCN